MKAILGGLVLAFIPVLLPPTPATAEPATFGAPYECGTDQVAQQSGVLHVAGVEGAPDLPPVEACKSGVHPVGSAAWVTFTATTAGSLTIHSTYSGYGTLCTFATIRSHVTQACDLQDVTVPIARGDVVTAGAVVPAGLPGLVLLQSLTLTAS